MTSPLPQQPEQLPVADRPPPYRHHGHQSEPDPTPWRRRLVLWGSAIVAGLVSVFFVKTTTWAYDFFVWATTGRAWIALLITPPAFALFAWITSGKLRGARGSGIPEVIASVDVPEQPFHLRLLGMPVVLAKMLLTIGGLAVGASIGREGPTVHVAAGIMYAVGRRFGFDDPKAAARFILAGGGAGLAAAFNTPLAGVVFAIEEIAGAFEHRVSGIIITAVFFSGLVSLGLLGDYTYFGTVQASLPLGEGWIAVVVFGLVGGLLGGIFARLILLDGIALLRWIGRLRERFPIGFALACGLALVALGLSSHGAVYGSGYDQARALLQGTPSGADMTFGGFKLLANVVSYWAGIPGGLFSPALAVGTGIGQNLTFLFPHLQPSTIMVLGMAGYLAGVTQTPLTASVISMELTNNQGMVLPILAVCLLARASSALVCKVPVYRAFADRILEQHAVEHAAQRSNQEPS